MSIERNAMLTQLKALPDSRLSELIFRFQLDDTISANAPPAERAMGLIKAVEALPPDSWQELEALVASPAAESTMARLAKDEIAEAQDHSQQEWQRSTVEQFIQAFRACRSNDTRRALADIMGFDATADHEVARRHLHQFIGGYLAVETFDVERISLIVARFDALRMDQRTQKEDIQRIVDLQDLLLPLCLHPAIKNHVARLMEKKEAIIISEAVALVVGAEMTTATADGLWPGFHVNDRGQIAGKGLLHFVDAAIGDPDPNALVCEILRDLADQWSVNLDDDPDEQDNAGRITFYAKKLKLAAMVHRARFQRRHYCVVNPPKNPERRASLVNLLTRVRLEVPDLVFFELHSNAKIKQAEEVVMQILKDRLKHEAQS